MQNNLYGIKGGVGTTTAAVLLAQTYNGRVSSDQPGDLRAILGLPTAAEQEDFFHYDFEDNESPEFYDRGKLHGGKYALHHDKNYLVVKNDYVNLRRFAALDPRIVEALDGVILTLDGENPLQKRDCSAVIEPLPIVAVIAWTAGIARLVDAGLLLLRRPRHAVTEFISFNPVA